MECKISFIIPTLNEEKMIAMTIKNISKLARHHRFEIIVADSKSSDKTCQIAQSLGAKIVVLNKGPRTIANGRNAGAKKATGDIFIFCDADTLIQDPNRFVSRVVKEFEDKDVVAAVPRISVFEKDRKAKDKMFHFLYNNLIRVSFKTRRPYASGQCQIVRSDIFKRVKGYDQKIVHGEDSELFQRLSRHGKLHFFDDLLVYESPRRYRSIGYARLFFISAYSLVLRRFFNKNSLHSWQRTD